MQFNFQEAEKLNSWKKYILKSCPQITNTKSYGYDFLHSDIMQGEGHGITFVVFLPNKYKLNLTM